MQHEHFAELKEWSERKHELVIRYLTGFVRILGGARKGSVYYIDGFAGPGIYNDGAKGSPIRAAEYAKTLSSKDYQLYCINVEADKKCFNDLAQSTIPYQDEVTNYLGKFGDHVNSILEQINDLPAIFFLDPFGVKGLEWEHIRPILERPAKTEILLRINPKDISRLAGFSGSNSREAAGKRKVLTELYGFADSKQWEEIWHTQGSEGLLKLYKDKLLRTISTPSNTAYICSYAIKSIDGIIKYYLLFATRHPKGAILMSNIIYGREKCYERDIEDYKRACMDNQKTRQMALFDSSDIEPSEQDIFTAKVKALKTDIWQMFAGKRVTRQRIHLKMLSKWFGQIGGRHITSALKDLEENDKKIIRRSGQRSHSYTKFKFATQDRTNVL